jgi:hypothetical protein
VGWRGIPIYAQQVPENFLKYCSEVLLEFQKSPGFVHRRIFQLGPLPGFLTNQKYVQIFNSQSSARLPGKYSIISHH